MPSYIKSLKSNLGDLIIPRTTATAVTYDNSTSGLESINTQDAIDEMMGKGWISSDDSVPTDPAVINADSLGGLPAADYATNESVDNKISSLDADSVNAANKDLSNLSDYQRALRNIGGRPNKNLLDNWYFVGGGSGYGVFPVNQKPRSNPQDGSSIADRWKSASGDTAYSLEPDGLLCSGGTSFISQKSEDYLVDYLHGKRITISSLWLDNYLFSHTWVFDKNQQELANGLFVYIPDLGFIIPRSIGAGNQKTMVAAKLEKGDKQTLAYQDDAGDWQLLETPNYSAELVRCQQYYCQIKGQVKTYASTSYLVINQKLPVTMRTKPAITVKKDYYDNAGTIGNFAGSVAYTDVFAVDNAVRPDMVCALSRTGGAFAATAGEPEGYDYVLECSAEL